jgi:hypothetical protein
MEEVFLKLDNGNLAHIFWSSNPPCDPFAEGVASINIYDSTGKDIDGGELDSTDPNDTFSDDIYLNKCLDYIGFLVPYERIDEEAFYSVVPE